MRTYIKENERALLWSPPILFALSILAGIVVEPGQMITNVAVYLTITAALIGVVAIVVAIASVPDTTLPEAEAAAIREADEEDGLDPSTDVDSVYEPENTTSGGGPRKIKNLPGFLRWPAEAVPLYVLADIVQYWREQQVAGERNKPRPGERWNVREIEHAIRKDTGGRGGAPAWYVKFRAHETLYKVASGGKGRREADPDRRPAVQEVDVSAVK